MTNAATDLAHLSTARQLRLQVDAGTIGGNMSKADEYAKRTRERLQRILELAVLRESAGTKRTKRRKRTGA